MKHKQKKHLIAIYVYVILLGTALTVLASFSLNYKQVPTSYTELVRSVSEVMIFVEDNEPKEISLPAVLSDLAPHTPVILTAEVLVHPGDSLNLKSVFAPVQLYIDDVLIYASGQQGSYPPYMNDPPTILTTVAFPDKEGIAELRIEYLSPTQRSSLSLPTLFVGNEAALLANQFQADGFSLLFSIVLICLGLAMVLIFLTIIRKDDSGSSFLWLGLFSLSAGVWVLGECDLTAFLMPYPTLLYNMAYLGLFLMTIPFLRFGLVILNPESKLPFQIMLGLNAASVAVVLMLQLSGIMDFIKSLYWFHIIVPLGFVVFTICLLLERFKHHNPAAKRFSSAIIMLAASTILEVLNYWMNLNAGLTVFFQFGALAFVISLGIVSGYYVRESIYTAAEKTRLEYEMAAASQQLELQKLQYQKIAENDAEVKSQRHDLRHQLAVIRNLNEQGNQEKLGRYIDTLIRKIPSDKELRLCENYAINAVAYYYASAAAQQNIKVDLRFAIPPELTPIIESDLCIVVGNLLENAVEACMRMTDGERFIRLYSNLEYGTLTITVDNSFDGNVNEKKGVFLSSKREGIGIGLSSVASIAKKYDGGSRFEAKNNVFQASIYIHLHEQSA